MWMRGEQLKIFSALFSPRFQRENGGDRDCVWHGRGKKKEHQNLSHLNQRKLFWRLNKDKRTAVALWDLSHAESRTFRPFEDKTLAREKKKMGHTLWNIWSEIQRENLWGNRARWWGISSQSLWNMFQRSAAEIRTHSNEMNTPSNNQYPHVASRPILCFVRRNAMHEAV